MFVNRGDGTFEPSVEYATGAIPLSIIVDDFNLDGRPDIAVATGGEGRVSLFLGRGDGTFGVATEFEAGERTFFVSQGDFNGDGRPDIATANFGSSDVTVLLNTF